METTIINTTPAGRRELSRLLGRIAERRDVSR